jgi:hypothetical protein
MNWQMYFLIFTYLILLFDQDPYAFIFAGGNNPILNPVVLQLKHAIDV